MKLRNMALYRVSDFANFSKENHFPNSSGMAHVGRDFGTKKNGEPERRSLSVCRGARGAASPGSKGLEAPPGTAGSLGRGSPPVKTI